MAVEREVAEQEAEERLDDIQRMCPGEDWWSYSDRQLSAIEHGSAIPNRMVRELVDAWCARTDQTTGRLASMLGIGDEALRRSLGLAATPAQVRNGRHRPARVRKTMMVQAAGRIVQVLGDPAVRGAGAMSAVAQPAGRERGLTRRRANGGAGEDVRLPVRVRLADGRTFSGTLPARKHRALQLRLLHGESAGLVELTPGTRPPGGKVDIDRRKYACDYLPGGAGATSDEWLERLLDHAERIVAGAYAYRRFDSAPREEAFVGVAARTRPQGSKQAVDHTRFLWVDVDKPGELPVLWGLLAERPCHLLVESAGSGGMHAYWKLAELLPSVSVDGESSERVEWIKRANLRLIHRIGTGPDGRPSVADEMCAEQARVMRLAATINYKTGRYARLVQVDLSLAPYSIAELVGDLQDPPNATVSSRRRPAKRRNGPEDPYRRIPPPEYFAKLAGVTVPRSGYVLCPSSRHTEKTASCRVWLDSAGGWWCFGCGAGGAIYDLASLMLGGPTGQGPRRGRLHGRQAAGG